MAKRRRQSTKLITLKNKAKREGWLKYLRKGDGEEADERALLKGCRFDVRRAEHFCTFADRYGTLTEGAFRGQKFDLQDWQRMAAMRVFGWVRDSPEWRRPVRRFRFWYLEVPKKNGKTPFAALIGLYLLTADAHGRQVNVHTAATTRKQADKLLTHAARQIKNRKALADVCDVKKLEGFQEIHYRDNQWNVLAADPASSDGINGHVIADEVHRWIGFEFFNTLRWALASQPEGLFAGITTAGSNLNTVCRSLHEKTKAINAGRQHDETFYGEIFAADPEDDPHDEETWKKANPSLGTKQSSPLKLSTFRADYEAAKADPTEWAAWLQLRLNLWRTGGGNWIDELGGIHLWDAGEITRRRSRRKRIDCYEAFTAADLEGQTCYAALDGATHHDTTSLVLAFPDEEVDELVRVLAWFWMTRAEAERQNKRVPYQAWSEEGLITLTDGDAVDFNRVHKDIVEILPRFGTQRLYFDPMFQAEWLTERIAEDTSIERVEFPQTIMWFSQPTKTCERLIALKKLRHNGHKVLTWQLGNTQVRVDSNNNKRPKKRQKDDYRTVDGVVSMIMAIRDAAGDPESDYYDEHDVEFV